MAELANGREGAARLAVHLDALRSDDQRGLVVHGPVFTFGDGTNMCWLRVTFWVGEQSIFQQDVMVQWASIRNWPHELEWAVEHHSQFGGSFGIESPELIIEVEQSRVESAQRDAPKERYSYEVLIGVDTGIAAGNFGVSREGPVMRFFPTLDTLRQFSRDLKAEARFVRLLEGLDVAEVDYEAARLEWPFNLFAEAVDEDDWSI
jgi:hypothetical protein